MTWAFNYICCQIIHPLDRVNSGQTMPVMPTSVRDSSLPEAVLDIKGFLLKVGVAALGKQL
eukprot:scaffold19697_cov30-Attheya_sp.AAC.2